MSPIGVYVRKPRVYPIKPLAARFWAKVDRVGECWEWQASGSYGYGRIRAGRQGSPFLLTHRVAWELVYGPIPAGLFVLHHCDNRRCVRSSHLFLGTHADNMHDAFLKGRCRGGRKPKVAA